MQEFVGESGIERMAAGEKLDGLQFDSSDGSAGSDPSGFPGCVAECIEIGIDADCDSRWHWPGNAPGDGVEQAGGGWKYHAVLIRPDGFERHCSEVECLPVQALSGSSDGCARVIDGEDFFVRLLFAAHFVSAELAEADAVTVTGTFE